MAERHTVVFESLAFNVLTDHERRVVTMQFEPFDGLRDEFDFNGAFARDRRSTGRIVKAVRAGFGSGPLRRLARLVRRRTSPPLVPSRRFRPHSDNPGVVCWDMRVRDGTRPEEALAALLDLLRRLPGYQRTLGPPLDPDEAFRPPPPRAGCDASEAANAALHALMKWREARPPDEPEAWE